MPKEVSFSEFKITDEITFEHLNTLQEISKTPVFVTNTDFKIGNFKKIDLGKRNSCGSFKG